MILFMAFQLGMMTAPSPGPITIDAVVVVHLLEARVVTVSLEQTADARIDLVLDKTVRI